MAQGKKEIDWGAVENCMRRSIRGRPRSGDHEIVSYAWGSDRSRYAKLGRRVRKEEQAAMNPLGNKGQEDGS